jgi:hypothetical protein
MSLSMYMVGAMNAIISIGYYYFFPRGQTNVVNLVQVHTLFMFVLNSHLFFLIYEYHINREINALHYNDSFKSFRCVKL